MTIETKFNINDLVQHKFQRDEIKENCCAYEILEISSINCYTTSQVFYKCRPIIIMTEKDYKTGKRNVVDVLPGIGKDVRYQDFREDELKPCSEEAKNTILNVPQ